jgi:hypothetical protein
MGRCPLTPSTTKAIIVTTADKPAAPDAATRKALDRADHHGCAACGQPFDYGQPTGRSV